ncbi:MAG: AAA family ATPase, partial [Bradyrhizobium sp.]|nr:AAA family ATPase [Bradyrhizobium sp.]
MTDIADVVTIKPFMRNAGPPDDGYGFATEYPESALGEPDYVGDATPLRASSEPPKVVIGRIPPLTPAQWAERDLPAPDFLLGDWLTSTSRALMTADTGLGKSNLGVAIGMRISAARDFLHWRHHRPARVLYIDGEMSRRLLKQRIADEETRMGVRTETFFVLSCEDIENRKPLNSPEGAAWLKAFIKAIGGVDLIIFDNIMSLTVGDMKDPEAWQKTMPLVLELTKAKIGQIWIHHTGKNTADSYGDKSREWQMDTVLHLDAAKRPETDVSFSLSFKKARERTPSTRFDFQDVKIALVNDCWEHELTDALRPGTVSPSTQKALDALNNVLASDQAVTLPSNRRAGHRDHWASEANARGLIDLTGKPDSARTL